MIDQAQWLTLDEASRLTSVTITTLRGWCKDGRLEVERRGEVRVVRLDQVRALASGSDRLAPAGPQRSTLQQLLNGAASRTEHGRVAGLQELIRGRLQPA